MMHITEEEMVDGYYAGVGAEWRRHLDNCDQCSTLYRSICETLETASEAGLPERGARYSAEVWARVSADLPVKRPRKSWVLVPALAALGTVAFVMWNERRPPLTVVVAKPAVPAPHVEIATKIETPVREQKASRRVSTRQTRVSAPQFSSDFAGGTPIPTAQVEPVSVEIILRLEPNPDLRVATVRSLAVLGERSQALVNIYRVDSDEKVRTAVLDALVAQRNTDALSGLAKSELDAHRKAEILSRLATVQTR